MCAIAGKIHIKYNVEGRDLEKMLDSMVHRGPDGEGKFIRNNVALGMRRLSIIDIAGGNQPIFNEKKDKMIIFNGELYNYKQLRSVLLKKGHKFRTKSDTEVVLHYFEEYGTEGLRRLNGMWAMAIYDMSKNEVFLARDHVGIKPLAYYLDEKQFIFSSEIKALIAGGVAKKINPDAVIDYLALRFVPESKAIWKGVKKLQPGHWMKLNIDKWRVSSGRFWGNVYLPDQITKNVGVDEWLRKFEQFFEDSILGQLQADVPVGILLSGGLDSAVVARVVKNLNPKKTTSFSVGFKNESKINELKYSRLVAKSLGIENYEVEIEAKDFLDYLPQLPYQTDEPLADLAAIPLFYVSKLAKAKVTVVLSGEGSDEMLAGYDFDRVVRQLERMRKVSKIWPPANKKFYNWPSDNRLYISRVFTDQQINSLIGRSVEVGASKLIENYYREFPTANPLDQMLYAYSQTWLVDDLLAKADRMTMANSLELRVPFLDYRLVELCAKIPVGLKVGKLNNKLVTKKLLRLYAKKLQIPQTIIDRDKMGFPVPAYDWLSNSAKGVAEEIVQTNSRLSELFNKNEIMKIFKSGTHAQGRIEDKHKLWQLIILELWMRKWMKD